MRSEAGPVHLRPRTPDVPRSPVILLANSCSRSSGRSPGEMGRPAIGKSRHSRPSAEFASTITMEQGGLSSAPGMPRGATAIAGIRADRGRVLMVLALVPRGYSPVAMVTAMTNGAVSSSGPLTSSMRSIGSVRFGRIARWRTRWSPRRKAGLRAGHLDAPDVAGELDPAAHGMVLDLAVGVVEPDDQRGGHLAAERGAPAGTGRPGCGWPAPARCRGARPTGASAAGWLPLPARTAGSRWARGRPSGRSAGRGRPGRSWATRRRRSAARRRSRRRRAPPACRRPWPPGPGPAAGTCPAP